MRILLDECVPRRLRRQLPGHDVRTVPEMGWSGKKNGDLLRLMAGQGFEVLLTVDQSPGLWKERRMRFLTVQFAHTSLFIQDQIDDPAATSMVPSLVTMTQDSATLAADALQR